jgi:elongation factor Ts
MGSKIDDIKVLRSKTSAGMALCKEALEKSDGDMEKATQYINERSDVINRLHNLTGAKIGLCKVAYEESGKDFEKAVEIIKERGWDEPIEPVEFEGDGIIEAYVHGKDQRLVSLVEVTCKTDFVARNEKFREFAHEIALQVAALKPEFVSENEMGEEKINELKELFKKEAEVEGKPESIIDNIVEGKLDKYLSEKCLLEQKWFKDESKTIQNLLDDAVQQLGEPIAIRRFTIWELGK